MPGLLRKLQARARRPSVALAGLFLAVLLTTAFGHHCASGDLSCAPAPAEGTAQVAHGTPLEPVPDHSCPACAFQRSTVSTAAAAGQELPLPSLSAATHFRVADGCVRGGPLSHPSRGPPPA